MQTSTNRYFAKTHEKNLDNWEDKPIRSSNNKFLQSMYQECLKRIDRLETEVNERQLKTKLNISPSKKLENQIFLEIINLGIFYLYVLKKELLIYILIMMKK